MEMKINGILFTVPANFYTDGASNIRLLWNLCPPMSGATAEPSVLHDWLYSLDSPLMYSKIASDDIYLAAMEVMGVSYVRRNLIYQGVNLFGGSSYKAIHSVQKCTKDNLY